MRQSLVILAVSASLSLLGCKEKQPAPRAVEAPTTQDAETLGKEFATLLAPCNSGELDRLIDSDLLMRRAVATRKLSKVEVDGIIRGVGKLGQRVCTELVGEVSATYLRTQTIDGVPRPLIRLLVDNGMNYYQLELDKTPGGLRVADIYVFMAGEKMSETFGRAIDSLLESGASSAQDTIAMQTALRGGNFAEAKRLFDKLPATLRTSKPLMLTEVTITMNLDDASYAAAMDRYVKAFPGDPSLLLVQIDHLFLKKEFAQMLATLDQLDKQVGGDPYLAVLRTEANLQMNKPAEALAAAEAGVKAAPSLMVLWSSQLVAQSVAGKYADAVVTLDAMKAKFAENFDPESLAGEERTQKLTQSPEYKAWAEKNGYASGGP